MSVSNLSIQKVVIYSGSFDPLHNGHKTIIGELYNKFDNIYIVPEKYNLNMMFSNNTRLKFINDYISKCFSDSNKIHVLNDVLEDETNELSKTFNLINHIKNKYLKNSEVEIYICIGWDQYENLKKWFKYQQLLKIVKLIVVNRGDKQIERLYSDLNETTISLEIHGYENLSSTKIREAIYNYVILN